MHRASNSGGNEVNLTGKMRIISQHASDLYMY